MIDAINKAISYISSNDNVSRDCALCLIKKQALRVIAGERKKSDAVRSLFYAPKRNHPMWQYQALNAQISELMGA